MKAKTAATLLDALALPVIVVDAEGNVTELNAAALALTAKTRSRVVGRPLDDTVGALSDVLAKLVMSDSPFEQQVRIGNAHVFDAKASPLPEGEWVIELYNVTSYIDKQQMQNMVLGEVAHDLKQPLSSILSFSDVLEASGELNDRQKGFLNRIRTTATNMNEQVIDLLDMVWIAAGKKLTLVEIDMAVLVRHVLDDVSHRAERSHITLKLDSSGKLPGVVGDYGRLVKVVTNLMTNAIKYSPEQTTVTIKLRSKSKQVILSVTDQGYGIAPEHLPHLFERFYRVPNKQIRRQEGTGLGLYITRYIVEQHGGMVEVSSTVGKGSTFTVTLPTLGPVVIPIAVD